jgi:hypothetical protein
MMQRKVPFTRLDRELWRVNGPPFSAPAVFLECQHWQVTCRKKRMKKQVDEGIRTYAIVSTGEKGRPADSGGQSGDTQGLPDVAEAGSESVEELIEEGQSFEAAVIGGVEDAPDPDVAEVHTRQVPEDDVPSEYLGRD